MSDPILEILQTFGAYFDIVENPNVNAKAFADVNKIFQCCQFIEATISEVYEKQKESAFEQHLNRYLSQKNKIADYKCIDFKLATDKVLEIYLKHRTVPLEVVDEFLKLYTNRYGIDRLNKFLKSTLTYSICTNEIVKSLEELGVPSSELEDEVMLVAWESAIKIGHQNEVHRCIYTMISEGHFSKLITFAVDVSTNKLVTNLIVQFMLDKVTEYDPSICAAFINLDKTIFLKFVKNNSEFFIHFMDAIFYFGRNMKKVNNKWISDYEFTYNHLLKVIKALLNGPDSVHDLICARLENAKEQLDDVIWRDVEIDLKW